VVITLYKSQSQRYYFQDGEDLYEGEPGVEMGGQMRYIGKGASFVALSLSFFALFDLTTLHNQS